MPKANSGFYAVKRGKVPGVYLSWEECERQVKGVPGASYKKFRAIKEAEAFAGMKVSTSNSQGTDRSVPIQTATGREAEGASVRPVHRIVATASTSGQGTTPGSGERTGAYHRGGNTAAEDASVNSGDELRPVIVYTDGACSSNGRANAVAGIGVWWGWGDKRNLSERCPGPQTNNRAEIYAIVRLLEQAPMPDGKGRLVIRTDSKYTIQCVMEWAHRWEAKGWMKAPGEEVKNAGMLQYLLALLRLRTIEGEKITFEHVRGHSGNEGNDAADGLARGGTTKSVIPEKDWLAEKRRVEESIEHKNRFSKTLSHSDLQHALEFVIEEGDLLSSEELEELERTQQF